MNDKLMVLGHAIRKDMEDIASLYTRLDRHSLQPDTDAETLIIIAYYLRSLYNAFENIFQNIATEFENWIDGIGRWHGQLLERMRLDVMSLRPAVIDDAAYKTLDELRRFRNLFDHAYGVQLDPLRMNVIAIEATHLKTITGPNWIISWTSCAPSPEPGRG